VHPGKVPAKPGESPDKKRPKIDEKSPKKRAKINQNRVRDAAGDRENVAKTLKNKATEKTPKK
jgi:hypothetical protein